MSLSSIRKWILEKHPETRDKQKASFNSLTIKVSLISLFGELSKIFLEREIESLARPGVFHLSGYRPISISISISISMI